MKMNLPNFLTVLRILSIPVLVVVLLSQFEGKELAAVIIFLLAALTDMLDGFLARKKQQITTLGEFSDPIADKLLITAALVNPVLTGIGRLPIAQVVIVIVAGDT